jgi:hypothetical protein
MAVTTFPSEGSPDLALLNVARLFTRLEHNLLSPGTDRRSFQQSEYQRMRVNKVSIPQPGSASFASSNGQRHQKSNLTNPTERRIRPLTTYPTGALPPPNKSPQPQTRSPSRDRTRQTAPKAYTDHPRRRRRQSCSEARRGSGDRRRRRRMEGTILQSRRRESYTDIRTKRPTGTDTEVRFATRRKGNKRSATNHYIFHNDYNHNPITNTLVNKPANAPNSPQPPHGSPATTIYGKSSGDGKQDE